MSAMRSTNFTEAEKSRLLNLIEDYKDVIENKKTDSISSKEKHKAWEDLAKAFNATETNPVRKCQQLRTCYENLKRRGKKKVVDGKVGAHRTDIGSAISKDSHQREGRQQIKKGQIRPIPNPTDSDADYCRATAEDNADDDLIYQVLETNLSGSEGEDLQGSRIDMLSTLPQVKIISAPTPKPKSATSSEILLQPSQSSNSTGQNVTQQIKRRIAYDEVAQMANTKTRVLARKLLIMNEQHVIQMKVLKTQLEANLIDIENRKLENEIKKATLANLMK